MLCRDVFQISSTHSRRFPLALSRIPAGFPSPADDYTEVSIDLNEHLVRHPSATFFMRVSGDSMEGAGIFNGDMLIVDRAEPIAEGRIVVAVLGGELTVKQLKRSTHSLNPSTWELHAANPKYPMIPLTDEDSMIWGTVIHVIRQV